ncbi:response regulator transcription factor [Euzebya sp.]|uniref:response regulator transcription factor n=1 Tax=Euzebya sp. TaxID=1971409 RepID=UPI0035184F73
MTRLVLVVEDEPKIRELVRGYLERDGFGVLTTDSGAEALDLWRHGTPDLLIVDLGLPDVSGESLIREVRRQSDVPIIVLTARAAEEDRIDGLELGVDDYVAKPFSPRELVLRVGAVLRRGVAQEVPARRSYGGGDLILDDERREVGAHGEVVELTPTEWSVLQALARVPGRVYSRLELVNDARGYEFAGYERTIDTHVKNLRRKVEHDPGAPTIVETVVGVGYRFGLCADG